MPQVSIGLSVARGIERIQYGSDPHNYVHPASGIPVVRAGFGPANKNYQPLTRLSLSQTNAPEDTLILADANAQIARLSIVAVGGNDSFRLKFALENLSQTLPITTFDVKGWTHAPFGTFSWDGTTPWATGGPRGGWEINSKLCSSFSDTAGAPNRWQLWSADTGAIHLSFNNKGAGGGCEVFLDPQSSQGNYPVLSIPAGGAYAWDIVVNYSANAPTNSETVALAPSAFALTAKRFPYRVRNELFPVRTAIGANWFCTSPPSGKINPVSNPNGWFGADKSLALYDPAGSGKLVAELSGDTSALKILADKIVGRIRWCNYIAGVKCQAISVVHWDLFDGQEYPQPGSSYLGDPRVSRTQCAELWFRNADFPVPIIQQALAALKYAYAGSDKPPTYLPAFVPGAGLRANHWPDPPHYTHPALTQLTWQSEDDAVENLSAKIDRLYWMGLRVFYVDSWGPYGDLYPKAYAADVMQRVMSRYPDILLIPEAYKRDDVYSAGRPWRLASPSNWFDNVIWPGSCGVCRFQLNTRPTDPGYAKTLESARAAYAAGDCIVGNCYAGTPTELELSYAMYQDIAAGTPSKIETGKL